MSGRGRRIAYDIACVVCLLCALGGTVAIAYFATDGETFFPDYVISVCIFAVVCLFLRFPVVLHELGHLFFGWTAGLRFLSVSVGRTNLSVNGISRTGSKNYAGQTQMLPKNEKGARGRMIAFSMGGIVFNLAYGIAFLLLFFLAPRHPALYFFELFAPLQIYEGLTELFPAELPAGRTDGKMIAEFLARTDYSRVFLSVVTAQGILIRHTYQKIPKNLLFETPVIQADEPANLALLQLRWQYLFFLGEESAANRALHRLGMACEESGAVASDLVCDLAYGRCVFDNDIAGARETFQDVRSKDLPALRTRYALTGEGLSAALEKAEKERVAGLKECEIKLIERAKKILPQGQN